MKYIEIRRSHYSFLSLDYMPLQLLSGGYMYRVYLVFNNGIKRVRITKTRKAAQLIAMRETTKREAKFFSIDRLNVTMNQVFAGRSIFRDVKKPRSFCFGVLIIYNLNYCMYRIDTLSPLSRFAPKEIFPTEPPPVLSILY